MDRTSRPEIPRFRVNFKHVSQDAGEFVQEKLVEAFLDEYLEADGYFFIRLLAANASDFVVQEVLEQLWFTYVQKYGEKDAKHAEDSWFEYRQPPTIPRSVSQSAAQPVLVVRRDDPTADARRKYDKQRSGVVTELLDNSRRSQATDADLV